MKTYLLLNLLIIIFPLAMSFESKVRYYKKYKYVFTAIFLSAIPYLIWDAYATYRGDWAFNERFVTGFKAFYLPIEEILFFITVPFSAIFVYESLSIYITDRRFNVRKQYFIIPGIVLLAGAVLFKDKYYTSTVLIFSGAFLLVTGSFFIEVLRSRLFWIYTAVMYVPFLIFNYILTSLPVVLYSPGAITGYRFLTIPAEDFFYSFSMLSLYLTVYLIIEKKWQERAKLQ